MNHYKGWETRRGEREKESFLNQESTRLRSFRIQTEEEKDPGM